VTLSARLAELAARRRDSLLDQVRKQSQPRRWPWQEKTARDRLSERGASLRAAATGVAGQVVGTVGAARETVRERVSAAPQTLGTTAGAAAETLQGAAEAVRHRVSDTREAAAETLQGAAEAVRHRVSDTREAAAQTLHGAAETARQRVSETGGAVSDAISGRVDATTGAINETLAAGQRRVRRGVRLARWSFWSFVGGVVTGVLVAPRSGEETRRELTAAAQHLSDSIFPPDRA
jgi:gas vesicle protein